MAVTGQEMDRRKAADGAASQPIEVELIAVLAAVADGLPLAMTIEGGRALPSGPFGVEHRSLQSGLRAWVERQTGHPLGYLEQLYTFADSDRRIPSNGARAISISYLGPDPRGAPAASQAGLALLVRLLPLGGPSRGPSFADRGGDRAATRALGGKRRRSADPPQSARRSHSASTGGPGTRNSSCSATSCFTRPDSSPKPAARGGDGEQPSLGPPMIGDHRRILATGIARVRAKIKYNPVVFELMPAAFTLLQLQRCVEAIAGLNVHKPNFRRLIEQQQLVEETGETVSDTGGRPAKTYRFRCGRP